ncbi:ketohexokinase [Methylophaga sp. 41_12_T18]|nr:ketohexokinase [Methylophaga sp. 41_12_T18]
MAKILAIGIATLDIINTVEKYPAEDDEIRVVSQRKARGGNATNTLAVLSQLGHQCSWAGVLINEPDAKTIQQDLEQFKIDTQPCTILSEGKMPTSYINHSVATGSRTIVHHRDCPEFSFADFVKINHQQYDWIHFEGRNITETAQMLSWLKQHRPNIACSLEVEKSRPDIESLFQLPQLLMFSQHYATTVGYSSAPALLASLPNDLNATCTWGKQGAWALTNGDLIHHQACPPDKVIDTLGAGDTFNAALISALLQQKNLSQAVAQACQLAGKKCGQLGFTGLIN